MLEFQFNLKTCRATLGLLHNINFTFSELTEITVSLQNFSTILHLGSKLHDSWQLTANKNVKHTTEQPPMGVPQIPLHWLPVKKSLITYKLCNRRCTDVSCSNPHLILQGSSFISLVEVLWLRTEARFEVTLSVATKCNCQVLQAKMTNPEISRQIQALI